MKFYDKLKEYENKKVDLYVDMDGVIAEYDIGNFDYDTIRPLKSNIKRIEELIKNKNITVKILTICKNNNIVEAKIRWIKKYMNFFPLENMIFISKEQKEYSEYQSDELKSNYLKQNSNKNNITMVVDDDNGIIKYLRKNNEDLIIFQVSSWID